MHTGLHRDAQLRADAICPADQDGVFVARGLQVEDAAKATDLCIRAGTTCGAHEGLNSLHERVPGVHRDARLSVSQALRSLVLRRQCPLPERVSGWAYSKNVADADLWAMSRLNTLPSKEMFSTPAYAASRACCRVGA